MANKKRNWGVLAGVPVQLSKKNDFKKFKRGEQRKKRLFVPVGRGEIKQGKMVANTRKGDKPVKKILGGCDGPTTAASLNEWCPKEMTQNAIPPKKCGEQ